MTGKVEWIGVRPARKAPVLIKEKVFADMASGLDGDHDTKEHRQVTLISKEALDAVAQSMNKDIDPAGTRRNIVISGLDFKQPIGKQLRIGQAVVEITGECHPCSRMDENLGEGGRAAMASKGGLTARIIEPGVISVGDEVNAM